MFKTLILCTLVLAAGCTKQTAEEAPMPAGASSEVSGTGTVTDGEQAGNLVLTPDNDETETYCLVGESAKNVKAGDRVQFKGERSAVLMLAGEQCLKLANAELKPL